MPAHRMTRKRQTRLTFTPIQSSSPEKPKAHVRIGENSSPLKKRKVGFNSSPKSELAEEPSPSSQTRVQVIIPSPARQANQLPTPLPSSQPEAEVEAEIQDPTTSSGEDEDQDIVATTRRRLQPVISLSSESEEPPICTPSSRRSRTSSSSSGSGSSTQPQTPTPPPSRQRSAKSFILGGTSGAAPISHSQRRVALSSTRKWRRRSSGSGSFENAASDSSFDGETPTRGTKRALRSSKKPDSREPRRKVHVDLNFAESESDLSVVNKSSNDASRAPNDNQNSTGSDLSITPIRRRHKLDQKRTRAGINIDESDLNAEVADLKDSDASEDCRTRARGTVPGSERKKRLNKLEELKRRRAGVVEVSDNESQAESVGHDNAGNGYADDANADLDEYEEDFIEDDDDESIGVDLVIGGVPLELTRFSNLKPFEYFKYTVEWMVHAKLNPAFERSDEVYRMAHQKLDDEVKVHAGSTFKSSVWNRKFTNALMSRPDIFRVDIPTMFEHKCDACNRSGHPPKHKIILTGNRYDENTLERISQRDTDSITESDDDDDNNNNNNNNTAPGNEEDEEKEEDQSFFLGRFCCANAEIAHTLYHWRYRLNQTIREWLSLNGHTTPEKILERENWSGKRRERAANRVVDGMVESGEMRDLYRRFKQNLDAARSAKVSVSLPFPSAFSFYVGVVVKRWMRDVGEIFADEAYSLSGLGEG